MSAIHTIADHAVAIDGRLLRIARLRDEYYVQPADPEAFVAAVRAARAGADLLTFVQELHDRKPRYPYHQEIDRMAVLPVRTYKYWYDKQLRFKARNKLKKALKSGMDLRVVPFDDALLQGIQRIYDETKIRQGKANWHYGKDLDTLRAEHATFLDRSEFVGAYHDGELIGFAKVTHSPRATIIMNIVGMIAHRDKAPTNALIGKAVELAAARRTGLLNYGVWGRRGLNDFKVSNAFECFEVPRYYVPLTARGALALKLGLHLPLKERVPERWIVAAADLRARVNALRFGRGGRSEEAAEAEGAAEAAAQAAASPDPLESGTRA